MLTEAVVFIHGVMPDTHGAAHTADYNALDKGIRSRPELDDAYTAARRIDVEWGWHSDPASTASDHMLLSAAEASLFPRVLEQLMAPRDLTVNPGRAAVNALRNLLLFGIGDVFYYVSEDGKYSVRAAVARQICRELTDIDEDDGLLSLTLIGHSLGSVIAFDLAFWLFFDAEHGYLRDDADAETRAALSKLRTMAQGGRLRIRRLFTFGSPVSLLAMRSNTVLKILASGDRIDPAFHGLTQNPDAFGAALSGPRWVNIFDRDDPIAWPARPLMKAPGELIEDYYVDVSDNPAAAHGSYWGNERVHERFGQVW